MLELSTSQPNQSLIEDREEWRQRGLRSLFAFNKAILGMKDLTPSLHGDLCDFITGDEQIRKIVQMSRAHLKTYVAGIGDTLHRAVLFLEGETELSKNYQEFPVLYWMSTLRNARRISGELARIFDHSPLMRWLYPNIVKGPEWSKDIRQLDYLDDLGRMVRRVTIDFKGIEAKVSSGHYRLIKMDDIHAAEEAMDSPPSVSMVVGRYEHSDSLVIEPKIDPIHLIGSPCSLHPPDVYECVKQNEADRYVWFVRPCYDKVTKQPAWPERFPRSVLEAIRRKEGDVKFSFQYILDPIDELVAEFRMSDFPRFAIYHEGGEPVYVTEDSKKYRLGDLNTFSIIDPAGWRGKGDENAILTMGTASDGRDLCLDEFEERSNPDQVINKVIEHHKKYRTTAIGVEEVAYQETLSFYIEKRIQAERLPIRVIPCKTGAHDKDARIRGVQPHSRDRQILLHDGLVNLIGELSHFPKGKKHLLDCLAYLFKVKTTPSRDRLEQLEEMHQRAYLRALNEEAPSESMI